MAMTKLIKIKMSIGKYSNKKDVTISFIN